MALWEEVPCIDFAAFPVGTAAAVDDRWQPSEAQLAVCARIDEVCRVHGFCTLRNTGIPPAELDASFAAGRALFGLDSAAKARLAHHDKKTGGNRGYFPFATEALNSGRANDVKEAYNVRRTAMDWAGCPPGFAATQAAMYETAAELADRFLLACAVALGLEPRFFVRRHVDKDLCTLRLLKYPALGDAAAGAAAVGGEAEPTSAVRAGEHTDFGAITIVFVSTADGADAAKGLQVRKPGSGPDSPACWLDVTPGPGEVVVNTGGLLAQWTNDAWTATAHRVVVTPAALRQPRYSMAFFVDPDSETLIECLPRFCSATAPPKYAPITSKDYLLAKLAEAQQRPGVPGG
jgi:isopenicillin N synthase-like dioxygenase